jgi:histone-lysine N-methyltransferase SETMAR
MFQEFGWEVLEHPACRSDLDPRDFYLFPTLKKFLGGRRFKSDEEVQEAVKEWLNGQAAEGYDAGTQKPVTGCDTCLNVDDNCVEKNILAFLIAIH